MPYGQVSGHNLGLWGRVRNTSSPFASSRYRETSAGTPNCKVITGSTLLRRRASGKVGISEEVWLQRAKFVTDPSNHPKDVWRSGCNTQVSLRSHSDAHLVTNVAR